MSTPVDKSGHNVRRYGVRSMDLHIWGSDCDEHRCNPVIDEAHYWAAMAEINALKALNADLLEALAELVRFLEPVERDGGLDVPGLATLNRYRATLSRARGEVRP